ncbi:MAG: ferredoxin [Oscillibacter sp.]|jgi:ferredoxin|nr:ferredoxin [Oscillibacter sp.]
MAFKVNDSCIGCGLCTGIASEVFELGDDGHAHVIAQPADPAQAREAKEQCPVSAIEEE